MAAAIERAPVTVAAIAPRTFAEAMEFARVVADSDLVPREYRGKPGNVMVAVQMGSELGLAPIQSVQSIAVINGRPGVWGDAMLALVQGHPECEDVCESFAAAEMIATCTVMRRGRAPVTRTFGVADARLATLWGKAGTWTQYPRRMLQMRARAFALRDSFADALRGIGMAEELGDIPARPLPSLPLPLPRPPAASAGADVVDAAPDSDPAGDDPADYVINFGKNVGLRMGDLAPNQLRWYSEECRDDRVREAATAVRMQRRRERALAEEAQRAATKADTNAEWGIGDAAPEDVGREGDEAEDPAGEHSS